MERGNSDFRGGGDKEIVMFIFCFVFLVWSWEMVRKIVTITNKQHWRSSYDEVITMKLFFFHLLSFSFSVLMYLLLQPVLVVMAFLLGAHLRYTLILIQYLDKISFCPIHIDRLAKAAIFCQKGGAALKKNYEGGQGKLK